MFILNLKSYPGTFGPGALRIGRALEEAGAAHGIATALAPAPLDLATLAHQLSIPVLGQHADPRDAGAHTGYVLPEALATAGARGSLVNHSEHPLTPALIDDLVGRLRGLGLVPVVCARDASDARRRASTRPDYLAVEPPELIGGSRAVSTAKPWVIERTVEAVRGVAPRTRVLCGAGVHTRVDVSRALELGAQGILVSSAVARARDPGSAIEELLAGFA